jgi:hypothetical protein
MMEAITAVKLENELSVRRKTKGRLIFSLTQSAEALFLDKLQHTH